MHSNFCIFLSFLNKYLVIQVWSTLPFHHWGICFTLFCFFSRLLASYRFILQGILTLQNLQFQCREWRENGRWHNLRTIKSCLYTVRPLNPVNIYRNERNVSVTGFLIKWRVCFSKVLCAINWRHNVTSREADGGHIKVFKFFCLKVTKCCVILTK